jgi:multiple sugar transport system permease protein
MTEVLATISRPMPTMARRLGRSNLWGYVLIAPLLLDFGFFTAYMVGQAVALSFQEFEGGRLVWVGLDNYAFSISDDLFWNALRNTFSYTLVVVPGVIGISLLVAAFIVGRSRRIQTLLKSAYYLPGVVSIVALTMVWLYIYQPQFGLLNFLTSLVGLPPTLWLSEPGLAMWAIVLMTLLSANGASIVLLSAAMGGIPRDQYESARMDGASPWQQFRFITVPLVKPTLLYLFVINFVFHFQVFEQIYLMTSGGPGFPPATETVAYRIFSGLTGLRLGQAAADSVLLFLAIGLIAVLQFKFLASDVEY